jgi:putative phosphoserine phosphatase/1-acylglycerol-3-phosphate O-acyltransferase
VDNAAFFDLDRTLLRGASGPVFSSMLKQHGLLPDRSIPGEGLVFKVFDVIGETIPAMLATRQMARAAAGWNRAVVQEAGRGAAELLLPAVPGFAKVLIARHHAEGRKVVMATTSPFDLVSPLAEALGMDAVLATRYGEVDGHYDGTVDGHFVWGPGKLAAVRAWAAENDVDVADSYAYSDSIYDLPLLNAVRHPTAINPDPRLRVMAVLRRWPAHYFDVPSAVPKLGGVEPQRALQMLAQPELFPWVRLDVDGVEHIPASGPAIIVANHRSYFDPLAMGFTLGRANRPVRFLGKKEVFDAPVVGQIVSALGGIRVDRGSGSDEPLSEAADALAAGEVVAIMPQGTIPRGRAFFDPALKGRWGAAKLAHLTGAPVIPIGLWGTEKVWPRNAKAPNVLALGHPPTVRIRVGAPVEITGRSVDADTRRIMEAITDLLPAEAHVRHEPTPEELRRSLPASYTGDLDAEDQRRPGRD